MGLDTMAQFLLGTAGLRALTPVEETSSRAALLVETTSGWSRKFQIAVAREVQDLATGRWKPESFHPVSKSQLTPLWWCRLDWLTVRCRGLHHR
jgi:hypothetical protein